MNIKDITGQRFGRLIAIKPTSQVKHHTRVWLCKCDCGNEHLVPLGNLTAGLVRSCGCLVREEQQKKAQLFQEIRRKERLIDGTDISRISTIADSRSQTGVRGVCPDAGKYRAYISFQGKRHYLGRYSSIEDAEKARKQAEDRLWGEFFEKHPELKEVLKRRD